MISSGHPAAADITALYERQAGAYVRARGRSTFFERPWIDRFLAAVPVGPVLDIGCGCGAPIARYILGKRFAVTGTDSAPSLIAEAKRDLPRATWIVADMRGLALGKTFGGILAWDSFFHLTPEDQRAMFAVFRAHAAPRAALMFTSGPHAGEAIGTFEGEPLYHASLAPAEYRALLEAHGFDIVDFVADDATCGGHTIWLAQVQ